LKWGSALALGGLLLAVPACSGSRSQEINAAPATVAAERRDLEVRAEAAGLIEPLRIVEVKSRVSGELKRITVETGDEIQLGVVIAEIDPRDLKNALEQAEADVGLARARVATTGAQHRRAEELSRAGVVSPQDLETAELEETNARAQLLKAETNLELAREKMGDVTIRSPIAGTVIEKGVEQGQIVASASANVSGGTTLVRMADLAYVQARALVDETDIGRVAPGQPATVTVEAYPGRVFRGAVEKIEPQAVVEQNVTMFPVLVRLANPERLLKPGMNAEVSIEIADRAGVVAIPNEAVVSLREASSAASALGLDGDAVREQLQARREEREPGSSEGQAGPAPAALQGGRGSGPGGWAGRRQEGGGAAGAATSSAPTTRPGVVFVKGDAGPEAQVVLLGVSDWDYTEVVRGIEPGTEVFLVSVARLKAQQQQFATRMRERSGTNLLGGGSPSPSPSGGGAPRAGNRP
jgi:HlyD family secretion protein